MQTNGMDSARTEVLNLRRQAAVNAQVGEFISDIYDMKEVGSVFDSLIKHLYQLTFFDKIVYLALNAETSELKVEFSHGFRNGEQPNFAFNIFENHEDGVASAIFDRKTVTIMKGFADFNDLSLRLDMDNYVMIPLVSHREDDNYSKSFKSHAEAEKAEFSGEEKTDQYYEERQKLKDPYFPISGLFVFGCGFLDDLSIKSYIPISEKLIRLAGMTINNILALQRLRLACERNEKELKQARAVQEKLLPEKLPCNDFLQSFAFYTPVEEVGGDYYDLFVLKEGIYAAFIADVSGHGVSAALVMSAAKILLKTVASCDLTPAQTLRKINDMLVSNISANRFLTAFYAIIDTTQKKIIYTCAGHCPILLFNKETKDYMQFQSDGFFVGMFPELDLPNHEYHYEKGKNRLILYTDGIVDCQDKNKAQFGLIRLKAIIARTLDRTPETVVETVKNDLRKFVGASEIDDDQTLLIVDF